MKATVVIPNLNGAGWLKDSIESIYAQTMQDFELIVIDNASTDESKAIAQSYVGRSNYTLIENDKNTGFSYAVNQGIRAAKGEYVALFNNDAFAEPDWLEHQALFSTPYSNTLFSYSLPPRYLFLYSIRIPCFIYSILHIYFTVSHPAAINLSVPRQFWKQVPKTHPHEIQKALSSGFQNLQHKSCTILRKFTNNPS